MSTPAAAAAEEPSGYIQGACLCGRVKATLRRPVPGEMKLCHCTDCRKFTGAIAAYILTMPEGDLTLEGEFKSFFSGGDSGQSVGRHFCGNCGSSLYDTGDDSPGWVFVHSGLFPPKSIPPPNLEIYWCNAESWEVVHPGCKTVDRQ
ncbi:hypothetical protein JCM24511_00807 [Saitozyma sp. JCM 24511]|nr:hypothetical protein JCM24511_00807 [Saitozyma sp. JCM 24511]